MKQVFWSRLLVLGLLTAPAFANDGAGARVHHRIQRGETLAKVARLYGVPLELLKAANADLVPEKIPAGARIAIPDPPSGWGHYTWGRNDSWESVAGRLGIPVESLQELNPEGATLDRDILTPPVTNPVTSSLTAPGSSPSSPSSAISGHGVTGAGALPSPQPQPQNSPPPAVASLPPSGWVSVQLADGSKAWAPVTSLMTYARQPLTADQVVAVANRFRGVSYQWGGQTPNGVDCSGYVHQVFLMGGYNLPRMADDQFKATLEVNREAAQPGDLVFFSTYEPGPSHVGIYLGGGKFVHASSSRGVVETSLDEPYYAQRFLGIHRIKEWSAASSARAPGD